jgi:hypothetical protein
VFVPKNTSSLDGSWTTLGITDDQLYLAVAQSADDPVSEDRQQVAARFVKGRVCAGKRTGAALKRSRLGPKKLWSLAVHDEIGESTVAHILV